MVEFIGHVTDDQAGPEGGWVVISPSVRESNTLLAALRAQRTGQAPDMLYGKLAYSNATLQITGRLGADIRESLQRPAEPNRWGGDVQCSVGPLSMGNVHLEFPSELDILISATAENSAAADMRDDLLDIRSWVMRGDVTPLADLE